MASSLESDVDDLYRGPLADFVGARAALAKTLSGADAQRVRKLPKPTLVPWAVNQVYWHARPVYDRLMKSGERLRETQVAALEGRKADVRGATEAHRSAMAEAVQQAERLAAAVGSHPPPDALMRTFEALSVGQGADGPPGRLTKPLQPAGFEALAGVKVKSQVASPKSHVASQKELRREAEARKKEEVARKKHDAAVRRAEAALERAKQRMADARAALDRTRNS